MYYDTTRLTSLRIAEAHRQADLERSLRPAELARPATLSVEPAVSAATAGHRAPSIEPALGTSAPHADCGPRRVAERAA